MIAPHRAGRLSIPVIAFFVLYLGFLFLRDGNAPKWLITIVAIIWGVGGVAALYWIFNWLVEMLPDEWTARLQPFVFIGPAMAILVWYLAFPTVRTFWISLFGRDGPAGGEFVGLANYVAVFTDRLMREAFRNNIFIWMLIATPLTVAFGLLVAVLADRSKFERVAKSLIFMPMAISFVGASVIWNFIYEVKPVDAAPDRPAQRHRRGVGRPTPSLDCLYGHLALEQPLSGRDRRLAAGRLCHGAVLGCAQGIPEEILEAARVDGATEVQVFFRIMIPYIMGTIITVTTTVVIFTLKIFDVVWVMTGGQFGTEVIATQFYRQSFTARNAGYGSAIAIVLLIAVIPVMIYNLRQFRQQEAF